MEDLDFKDGETLKVIDDNLELVRRFADWDPKVRKIVNHASRVSHIRRSFPGYPRGNLHPNAHHYVMQRADRATMTAIPQMASLRSRSCGPLGPPVR